MSLTASAPEVRWSHPTYPHTLAPCAVIRTGICRHVRIAFSGGEQ